MYWKNLQTNSVSGISYQHWYVTDGKNVIEFGGGLTDITNASITIHSDKKVGGVTEAKFAMTNEVMDRMKKLCGATNYSLVLRNCEHATLVV